MSPRSVPYALKAMVETELVRLEKLRVITPVDFSEWGTPIVSVLKKDGKSVRICGDFKVTINKYMEIDKYPLPGIEELFTRLQGGKSLVK